MKRTLCAVSLACGLLAAGCGTRNEQCEQLVAASEAVTSKNPVPIHLDPALAGENWQKVGHCAQEAEEARDYKLAMRAYKVLAYINAADRNASFGKAMAELAKAMSDDARETMARENKMVERCHAAFDAQQKIWVQLFINYEAEVERIVGSTPLPSPNIPVYAPPLHCTSRTNEFTKTTYLDCY